MEAAQPAGDVDRHDLAENRGREHYRQPPPVGDSVEAEHVGAQPGIRKENGQEEYQHEFADLGAPRLDEALVVMKQETGEKAAEDREDTQLVRANAHCENQANRHGDEIRWNVFALDRHCRQQPVYQRAQRKPSQGGQKENATHLQAHSFERELSRGIGRDGGEEHPPRNIIDGRSRDRHHADLSAREVEFTQNAPEDRHRRDRQSDAEEQTVGEWIDCRRQARRGELANGEPEQERDADRNDSNP